MIALTPLSRNLIIVFILLTLISLLSQKRVSKSWFGTVVTGVVGLVIYVGFLHIFADFPAALPSFSVGDDSRLLLLLFIIFICVILGTVAEYIFSLGDSPFSLRKMLTPLCVSPLVMLPLVGSFPKIDEGTTLQWVSLGFLGFQNGFFWRRIFEKLSG